MRVAVRETANVVETGLEVDGIDAHVDLLGGLVGRGEKSGAVVPRFRDRGVQRQARIKDADAAVGKTAALGIELGEGGHDRCRAGTRNTVLGRHMREPADFVAEAALRQRLDLYNRPPTLRK